MRTSSSNFFEHIRLIWAIAAKDILDALRNRLTFSLLIGSALVMLMSLAMPALLRLNDIPTAYVYDPDKSTLIRGLTTRSEFRLHLFDSQQEMQEAVAGSSYMVIGLTIPPGFRQAQGDGGVVEIDGCAAHWANPATVAARAAFFETQLSQASWQTVRIHVAARPVYPPIHKIGQPFMIAFNLVLMLLVVGMALVPHLMVEEKENHTFEALLVSPARLGQVVSGKAIAGLFYCLVVTIVVLAFHAKWFVHWQVVLVGGLLSAAVVVLGGLLMGAWFNDAATMNLWMGVLLMLLLAPVLMEEAVHKLPALLRAIIPWAPTTAMVRLFRLAMSGDVPPAVFWPNATILIVTALALYTLVVWRIRQADR